MKVVVTGANGYLGLQLVKALTKEGHEVVGIAKTPLSFEHDNLRLILGDVMEVNELLKGIEVDVIFHVAARVNFATTDEAIAQLTKDNILATVQVASFASNNKVKKVIYSSSCSVYEENYDPNFSITEEHTTRPRNHYATSKLAAEWLLATHLASTSTELVMLRYSSIYGYLQKPGSLLPILIQNASKNADLNLFGSGNRVQDYVYIDDVVKANLLCINTTLPFNTRLNIGSGESTTDRSLATEIKQIWESSSKINILNTSTIPEDYFNFNIEKAKQMLGYHPVSLKEGLKQYRENYLRG